LAALLEGFCPEPRGEEQIAVHCEGRLLLLRLAEVDWLESVGDRVAFHVGQKKYLLAATLQAVAAKLPKGHFVHVGPSTLLNVGRINA
jgi:DNA-binding LytR/AlgR family response regulator